MRGVSICTKILYAVVQKMSHNAPQAAPANQASTPSWTSTS